MFLRIFSKFRRLRIFSKFSNVYLIPKQNPKFTCDYICLLCIMPLGKAFIHFSSVLSRDALQKCLVIAMSQQLIEMRGPVSALSNHSLIAILPAQTELIGFENTNNKKISSEFYRSGLPYVAQFVICTSTRHPCFTSVF